MGCGGVGDSAILWWWLDSGGWLIGYVWSRERERERERDGKRRVVREKNIK